MSKCRSPAVHFQLRPLLSDSLNASLRTSRYRPVCDRLHASFGYSMAKRPFTGQDMNQCSYQVDRTPTKLPKDFSKQFEVQSPG